MTQTTRKDLITPCPRCGDNCCIIKGGTKAFGPYFEYKIPIGYYCWKCNRLYLNSTIQYEQCDLKIPQLTLDGKPLEGF